jgi:hypothetical protein
LILGGVLTHCPLTCDFDTGCVRITLTYLPVVHDTKYQAANHFCTLYSAERLHFKRFPQLPTSLDAFRLYSRFLRLSYQQLSGSRAEDYTC